MSESCSVAVEIDQLYCSKCAICQSVCPFEAVTRNRETDEFKIDIQKCQVCGICSSACPVQAIKMVYYDYPTLLGKIAQQQGKKRSSTLVLMCRANSPSTCEIDEILESKGLKITNYVPLRLPCSGRVPTEFILKALQSGVKNIVSIQCEDDFCRFKEGTKVNARRFALSRAFLEQMGYDKGALTVVRYSRKAVYDTEECVGCDKCVFICPYDAIEAQEFATPTIDSDKCVGCGACALVCPHLAIQLKGFEFDSVSKLMKRYRTAAKRLNLNSPVILVFCCQWSEFSALDDPESLLFKKGAVAMEISCFKSLDPVHVVQALEDGFDGVMAVVCNQEDCRLEKGRGTAERNLAVLRKALEKRGLLDRFEFFTTSPRCIGEFNQRLDEFIKKIAAVKPMQPIPSGGAPDA
jgi:coenzyme F420-reducing hydrogenase delta subunit/ferredoxin